jgi:hypothetical protein
MNRLLLSLGLISAIAALGLVAEAQVSISCTFPGVQEGCRDPQGRWSIQWRAPSAGGRHVLWLKPIRGGAVTKVLEFDRSVDLLWSPDGQALAITDRAGSSESSLKVASGGTLERIVNVEEKLQASLGHLPAIFNNGHRYFEVVRWVRSDALLFRVRAYDSEPGNEYRGTFRYNLTGQVTREPTK